MSGKARQARGCRSVICRHRRLLLLPRLPRLLRLCRGLFRPFARLGSWLWLFLVRVICFAYYSRPSRLNSAPVGLCALLFLRFGTCNMQISAAFCFRFCFVPELKQSEAPASSQTAQDPKLCATRNRNQMRAMIVAAVVVVVVRLVVCAGMWPDPPSPETVVVLPVNPRLLALKGLECLKWTCGIFQSVQSRHMCVKYP